MRRSIYKFPTLPGEVKETLEELRDNIAKSGMGVTLAGNRLTIRFGENKFRDVHMVILEVDDGVPEPPEEIPQ